VGRVLIGGAAIAVVALLALLAIGFFVGSKTQGTSTLVVVNRGSFAVSRLTLRAGQGESRQLQPIAAGSSMRFEIRQLREDTYSADLMRADGSSNTVRLGTVSDGMGIADTLFVSDSTVAKRSMNVRPMARQ